MTSFNKVILLGNLTRDPEVRYTPNGAAVASFAIAVNRKYKQGEETKEEVSYIDIVVFGKQAESCGQYINKGDSVLVDGRLQQRRWETEDGQKRNKVEVVAQSVHFMPKRSWSGQPGQGGQAGQSEPMPEAPVDEGDIPF
ncbi:MAG: single-stranded DNA-binding protein [Nitrospirae bacterium GWC2_57_13]|nr:MAG: single-stranded DNA-binding protein [Nitrospirae bacterium GWC1_57_7]OGW27960.1 MAG: single-stranded DNA-binding protein [Nitrospirae bacterium GWC2_57_13]OGW45657.1 MAG: single-stranded DNA-binding protein [Nitrospirae bacterium GWD2_57_8]HAS55312.1 single-stranded DNA-binding protein [Nitrospiraceae bacterium]